MIFDKKKTVEHIDSAVKFLKNRLAVPYPQILITQGTGQDFTPDGFTLHESIPYTEIPFFLTPTVKTHAGNLIIGTINDATIAILQGRFHYYEGFAPHEIVFSIRVLHQLGCHSLIITNTAGGLKSSFKPGSLMIINDHINNMGFNPLRGPNLDTLGPRFPDMSQPYSKKLIKRALQSAHKCNIKVHEGIYTAIQGPSLETPAETRFLQNCGADAVGMSTIPEVIAAKHLGMDILGISLITNVNNPDNFMPIILDDVIEQAQKAQGKLQRLLSDFLANHL